MTSPSIHGPVTVYAGDNRQVLKALPDASVDSVVCDPPYGLGRAPSPEVLNHVLTEWMAGRDVEIEGGGFMGRKWDAFVPGPEVWRECLRVLKPGGHLAAFFGTRTYDLGALAVRLAGFEIIDQLAWMYGQGFPKHKNALKPALEPVVLARRPMIGSVAANVAAHGTGGLNIDGCRVAGLKPDTTRGAGGRNGRYGPLGAMGRIIDDGRGRWPANVLHDGSDEVVEAFPDTKSGALNRANIKAENAIFGAAPKNLTGEYAPDSGSAARFFYCAKASKADRAGSKHPTVKPVALMAWLARLITPAGGVVLDPFAGSGTTAAACIREGLRCILIEREPEYVADIKARLDTLIGADLFGDVA